MELDSNENFKITFPVVLERSKKDLKYTGNSFFFFRVNVFVRWALGMEENVGVKLWKFRALSHVHSSVAM